MPFSPSDPATYLGGSRLLVGLESCLACPGLSQNKPPQSKSTKISAASAALWRALTDRDLAGQAPPLLTEMWVMAHGYGVGKMQSQYVSSGGSSNSKDVEIPTISCIICGSSDYYEASDIIMSGVQGPVRVTARARQGCVGEGATEPLEMMTPSGRAVTGREYVVNGVLYRSREESSVGESSSSLSSRPPRWKGFGGIWSQENGRRAYGHYVPPIPIWGSGEGCGNDCGDGGGS